MRKICLLTTGFGKGGAENQLFRLASFLRDQGEEVLICSLIDRNMYQTELAESGIPFFTPSFPRGRPTIFAIWRLLKHLRSFQPDLLISFMFSANIAGRILRLFLGKVKVITSIRNEKVGGKKRDILFRLTNELDHVVTTNSEVVEKRLIKKKIILAEKSVVVPNAVDLPNLETSQDDQTQTLFHWVAVGHFRPQKDYNNLFQAVSLMKEKEFQLSIAGNLFDQTWPLEKLRELGIEKKVKLLGMQNDLSGLYRSADALVLSSAWEGLPNVILEAMAYGVPIVATNVGGVIELVSDETGLTCPPKAPEALAAAMEKVMTFTASERRKMGRICRETVANNYGHAKVMNCWNELINCLIPTS